MSFFKNENNIISYTVNKEMGSNFYISVNSGEVVVNAPWYVSKKQIQTIIKEKTEWILEKIKEYQQSNNFEASKENIRILGVDHKVLLTYKYVKVPTINLENNKIKATLPYYYKKMESEQILRIIVEKLYNKLAEKEIERSMEKTRLLLGFAPEDYIIQRIKNNIMGICDTDTKKIIINPEVVKYDRKVIEYITLHQFCHLKYKIHSKGFWKMIEHYMPDYEKYEKIIST